MQYTKQSYCKNCNKRLDQHPLPSGLNCTARPCCVNCFSPFPASHFNCSAAPKFFHSKIVVLNTEQLRNVRSHGGQEYHAQTTNLSAAAQKTTPASTTNPTAKRPALADTPDTSEQTPLPATPEPTPDLPVPTQEQDTEFTEAPTTALPEQAGPSRKQKKGTQVTQYKNTITAHITIPVLCAKSRMGQRP